MVAPTHAIRQECNLLTVCYIISPSINKKAPTSRRTSTVGWGWFICRDCRGAAAAATRPGGYGLRPCVLCQSQKLFPVNLCASRHLPGKVARVLALAKCLHGFVKVIVELAVGGGFRRKVGAQLVGGAVRVHILADDGLLGKAGGLGRRCCCSVGRPNTSIQAGTTYCGRCRASRMASAFSRTSPM